MLLIISIVIIVLFVIGLIIVFSSPDELSGPNDYGGW